MIKVPDAASLAAMFFVNKLLGRRTGPSTGTNLWGAFELITEMRRNGEEGSVVTLICNSGDRYLQTYYSDVWLAQQKVDLRPWRRHLMEFSETGAWESTGQHARFLDQRKGCDAREAP